MRVPDQFPNDEPLARNSDESTSHISYHKITKSGKRDSQKKRLLVWMLKQDIFLDAEALTAHEISVLSGIDHPTVHKRLPDLMLDGFMLKSHKRVCGITGN